MDSRKKRAADSPNEQVPQDVRRVSEIRLTKRFEKDYKKLDNKRSADTKSTLRLIEELGNFPSGCKPEKLTKHIWYVRAGSDTRITFSYGDGGVIFLRRVGGHPILDTERKNA